MDCHETGWLGDRVELFKRIAAERRSGARRAFFGRNGDTWGQPLSEKTPCHPSPPRGLSFGRPRTFSFRRTLGLFANFYVAVRYTRLRMINGPCEVAVYFPPRLWTPSNLNIHRGFTSSSLASYISSRDSLSTRIFLPSDKLRDCREFSRQQPSRSPWSSGLEVFKSSVTRVAGVSWPWRPKLHSILRLPKSWNNKSISPLRDTHCRSAGRVG